MAFLTAAIKLGRSSAALALCSQYNGNDALILYEAQLCLLIEPDGKTLAGFGQKAEEKYVCQEEYDFKKYYYFTNILQKLSKKYQHAENDVTMITIEDEMGRSLPALTILTMAIGYLKNKIQEYMPNIALQFETDVYIVVMVPEFLKNTRAMELIRKAALELEIDVNMMSLITDFHAAAVYYQHFQDIHSKETRNKKARRFLVVKAGGFPNVLGCVDGTSIRIRRPIQNEADFVNRKGYHALNVQMCCDHQFKITSCYAAWPGSVHDSRVFRSSAVCAQFENARTEQLVLEVLQNGQIKDISPVISYEYGGISVDKAVEKVYIEIVGKHVWDIFKATLPFDYLDLTRIIETKKRCVCADTDKVNCRIPAGLHSLYDQKTRKWSTEARTYSVCHGDVAVYADKMRLSGRVFKVAIEEATKKITSMIKETLRTSDVDAILVFGGFAGSPVLQPIMQASLPNVNLVFVNSLKGAVMYGHAFKRKTTVTPRTTMVVAIDFGTTYSGWASSLVSEFASDRTKAQIRMWHSGSTQTTKTPTCILIRPDGKTREAFGYEAENKYKDLIERGEHLKYFYFQRFKMLLNKKLGEKINREITLEDEMGRSLPAIDVFALSIKFLKDDVLLASDKRIGGGIRQQDIHWVMTVPAIWTDGAKQFMREAAIKAGIESQRLTIALEPEAASIYCRHLSLENTVGNTGISVSTFEAGTRYMILDTGGGTIDITVHEVDNNDGVNEVHSACGGGWGGIMVDREFEKVLIALLSKDVYLQFKREDIEDWLDLWRDFEMKKRAVYPENTSPIRMRLPISLIDIFKEHTGHRLENAVRSSEYAEDIELRKDKIIFSEKLSRSFFQKSIDNTIRLVKSTLEDIQVKAILMVGGYSDSPMLQEAIRSTFIDIEVIVPLEASYSIMKGALIFGHLPKFITQRVLKYTYGLRTTTSFVEGKHPESKRIHTDKGDKCDKVFSKHVEKNQSVKVGEPQVRKSYVPIFKQQKQMRLSVYASEILTPEYTDQNCHLVGEMLVDLGDKGDLDRKVLVALTFSDTEIVVEATEKKTGKETYAAIDFLG